MDDPISTLRRQNRWLTGWLAVVTVGLAAALASMALNAGRMPSTIAAGTVTCGELAAEKITLLAPDGTEAATLVTAYYDEGFTPEFRLRHGDAKTTLSAAGIYLASGDNAAYLDCDPQRSALLVGGGAIVLRSAPSGASIRIEGAGEELTLRVPKKGNH